MQKVGPKDKQGDLWLKDKMDTSNLGKKQSSHGVAFDRNKLSFLLLDRKDYNSGEFGLNAINFAHTSFANVAMLQKVFVLWFGLYTALLGMIFCISQS